MSHCRCYIVDISVYFIVLIDLSYVSSMNFVCVLAFVGVTVMMGGDPKSLLCFLLNFFLISVCLLGLTVTQHASFGLHLFLMMGYDQHKFFVLMTSMFYFLPLFISSYRVLRNIKWHTMFIFMLHSTAHHSLFL